MKSDNESLSFGQYLQAIRLEKKISLEKVSEETRIGLGILKLIEKEDHEKLPAEVFVKGFLRAYARAIGADGEEAVQRYQSRLKVAHQLPGIEADSDDFASKPWWRLSSVLVVFAAVIFLSIYGLSFFQTSLLGGESVKEQKLEEKQPRVEPQSQKELNSDAEPAKAAQEKLLLAVTAQENTWLKIIIDNGDPIEYNLGSGDQLELEASFGFNLLIGNATGVKLTLNDKPIEILGKSGEIVNLQLP
jgi:cytoskeleton protein RodZ